MELNVKTQIRNYIQADIPEFMKLLNKLLRKHGYTFAEKSSEKIEYGYDYVDVSFNVTSGGTSRNVDYTYMISGDDILLDIPLDVLANNIFQHLALGEGKHRVGASRSMRSKSRIVAADEDEFDDFEDEELDEDVEESIDDIADTVDDMQDWLQDVEEDSIDIDLDANISNHYIVQCDGCQDIFISALVETDQDVEKITGICPCCEKSTDQNVKWIIREVGKE
jgi:hypothetical protein